MEFTTEDRDMLKAHDAKLKILCKAVDKSNDGIEQILKNQQEANLGCVTNRQVCEAKNSSKFLTIKTFGILISILIVLILGSYTYATINETNAHNHQINMDIHHTPIHVKAMKE